MKQFCFFYLKNFVFVFILINLFSGYNSENNFLSGKKILINLDANLETQYNYIIPKKSELQMLTNLIVNITSNNQEFVNLFNTNYEKILAIQDEEWLKRINIISSFSEIEFKNILILNMVYDVACTSIIINNSDEIFMGRNFDSLLQFSPEINSYIKSLIYEGLFYKNNKLDFIAQGIIGYAGILNAVKIGQYAVSINFRHRDRDIVSQITNIIKGYLDPIFTVYKALEKQNDYQEIEKILSETPIAAGVYYILSGVQRNEGVVITRSPDLLVNVERLDYDNGIWFLVQTNSEREEICERRQYAEYVLGSKEMKIDYKNLKSEILLKSPVLNNYTIFTTVQSPNGYFDSNYY